MGVSRFPMTYEMPLDVDILEAFVNKTSYKDRAEARRLKRALRKLARQ